VSENPAISALMKASWRKSSAEAAKLLFNDEPLSTRGDFSHLRPEVILIEDF
jgi:hypothetical protein